MTIDRSAIYGARRDQPATVSEVSAGTDYAIHQSAQAATAAAPTGAQAAGDASGAAMNWIAVAGLIIAIRVVWELSGGN